jgi:hypothetical protein
MPASELRVKLLEGSGVGVVSAVHLMMAALDAALRPALFRV